MRLMRKDARSRSTRRTTARADRGAIAGRIAVATRTRPSPPAGLGSPELRTGLRYFLPAPDFRDWIAASYLDEGAPLANVAHEHLRDAHLAVLWTDVENRRQMRRVVATAEMPSDKGGKWQVARAEQQRMEWFGYEPEFLLTFDADWAVYATDREFCAVVEHELYHCAQALDEFGAPRFNKAAGRPVFAIRGHDVEEFVGVVARYGAVSSDVRALLEVANEQPRLSDSVIAAACGTCAQRVA